jgi:hypothetical protein
MRSVAGAEDANAANRDDAAAILCQLVLLFAILSRR